MAHDRPNLPMTWYLVRCARCDRAFWQHERDGPVPAHSRWDRRTAGQTGIESTGEESRCAGGARPGYWIGEGEGPLRN